VLRKRLKYVGSLIKIVFLLFVLLALPNSLSPFWKWQDVVINLSDLEKTTDKMNVGVNTSFFRSIEDYNDERVWQAMHDAGIKTIRFPGGLGNWYHWETGGIDTEGRQIFRFMKDGGNRNIPMLDIIEKAKAFDMNISFDVNLTESNESLTRLVHFWKKHAAPIRWVEMGNEYYTKIFSKEIDGVQGYIRESVRVTSVMKKAGYHGKFGISLAPEFVFGKKNRAHYIEWNKALTTMNLSLLDAVIVHYYPVAETVNELLNGVPKNFSALAKKLRSMFPGKEIWVTEWSIGRPAKSLIFNTVGHAILDLKMLSVFQKEAIDLAIYHVFTGRGWELWGYKRQDMHAKPQVIRRVPYFAFSQFNHASMGSNFYSEFDVNEIQGTVFWKADNVSVILWNSGQTYYSFAVENTEGLLELKNAQVLQGDIMARNGSLLSREDEVESLLPIGTDVLEIPPYSFGLYNFSHRGGL